MIFYSPSAAGFFDDAIHHTLPTDALPIEAATHVDLLRRQSSGEMVVAGPDGHPIAVPRPSLPREALYADLRATRSALLAASDWTQMADAPLTDEERQAWRAYRKALRDLPGATPEPLAAEWPLPPA